MKKQIKLEVTLKLMRGFFLNIAVYTICILSVSIGAYLYWHRKIWYGSETLYPYLHFINDHYVSCFFFTLLMGCMGIACFHFFRFARMLDQVMGGVEELAAQKETYVALPKPLHEVEEQMNQILWQMRRDRQSAREAEQRKNDLIVYMAHDLKTPLTSIIGYLNLLQDETDISPEVRQKYLGIALHKSERLEDLINEFFEMTKYNFSDTILSITNVHLSRMLEQFLFEFQPLFREKGLTYETKLEPGLMVYCDVDKMERVFDNLFKNAVNYCYENTVIYVTLEKSRGTEGRGVLLTIQNEGKTIPQEKIAHLFEQFFRLDSSRSSKTGGSGLGLAIAKEIISLHKGTIRCDSWEEKIRFTVFLPENPAES